MSEQLSWKFEVQVKGGPMLAASGNQVVDAYSKSQVIVPASSGGNDGTIVLAVDTTGASIIVIKASQYVSLSGQAIKRLTCKMTPVVVGNAKSFELTGPLFLIGENAVSSLLGGTIKSLTFINSIPADITIDVLVGMDATP